MRHVVFIFAILIAKTFAIPNVCHPFTSDQTTADPNWSFPTEFYFGMNDHPTGNDTVYYVPLQTAWYTYGSSNGDFNSNIWIGIENDMDTFYDSWGAIQINNVVVMGGFNWTDYSTEYVRTANFTCTNDNQTAMWGPSYPDYRRDDKNLRGQYQHLEVYQEWSAPAATNYIRHTIWVTNKSDKDERFALLTPNYVNDFGIDYAPLEADGRYIALFPWMENDEGKDPSVRNDYNKTLTSMHARGPNARDTRFSTNMDYDDWDVQVTYNGKISAGETKTIVIVYSLAPNVTRMLERAAWIDSEPSELFHGWNADQLSQIVNWGACQSVLGPDVTVTITPPQSCSSDATSDFTVNVNTTRGNTTLIQYQTFTVTNFSLSDDITTGFNHSVMLAAADLAIVAPQSSTKLTVANDVGAVKHQLWYNGCLVKETPFNACAKISAPVSPSPSTSGASLLAASATLIGAAMMI